MEHHRRNHNPHRCLEELARQVKPRSPGESDRPLMDGRWMEETPISARSTSNARSRNGTDLRPIPQDGSRSHRPTLGYAIKDGALHNPRDELEIDFKTIKMINLKINFRINFESRDKSEGQLEDRCEDKLGDTLRDKQQLQHQVLED